MTITELKNALTKMEFLVTIDVMDEVIRVYENEAAKEEGSWFVSIPFDALLFFHLDYDSDVTCYLDIETVAKVEAIISLFLITPEEDRGISEVVSSEKQYTIPMPGLQTSNGGQQFLSEKDGNYFSCKRTEDLHQVFTESELEKLKRDNPRLAPAIDAMKEPAEEGEDDD